MENGAEKGHFSLGARRGSIYQPSHCNKDLLSSVEQKEERIVEKHDGKSEVLRSTTAAING